MRRKSPSFSKFVTWVEYNLTKEKLEETASSLEKTESDLEGTKSDLNSTKQDLEVWTRTYQYERPR